MSLERVDPFVQETRFTADHLLRYDWMRSLVAGKRVLDIACGSGFGSVLLAHANAAHVLGMDSDAALINDNRQHWPVDNIAFACGRIEDLNFADDQRFDVIACFETLEHVSDPEAALAALKSALTPDGILVGSVPGEADLQEDNPYHLQHFNAASLEQLLTRHFPQVRLLEQRFAIESSLQSRGHPYSQEMLQRGTAERLNIRLHQSADPVDSYVFCASASPLPDLPLDQTAVSRPAYLLGHTEARNAFTEVARLHNELKAIYRRYHTLFAEAGDLKRKFTNVLGWGRYHYEQLHGKNPETGYMDAIIAATSKREQQMRLTIEQLQNDLAHAQTQRDQLKVQLQEYEAMLAQSAQSRRNQFSDLSNLDS